MVKPTELLRTDKFVVAEITVDGISKQIIQHPGAVVILPFVDENRICLIKNKRVAVGEELIELPAGTLDPGEDPMVTAKRELAEETGYTASDFQKLMDFFVSPGIMNERMHAFVARELTAGKQNLMEDETITPLIIEFDKAIQWVQDGTIRDSKTIATLLYFQSFNRN